MLHCAQHLQHWLVGGEVRWQPNAKSVELPISLERQLERVVVVVGAADGREGGGQLGHVSRLGAVRVGLLAPEE